VLPDRGASGLQIQTRRGLRVYELIDIDVGITDGQRGCVAEPLQ
jgi:hypothetical protein